MSPGPREVFHSLLTFEIGWESLCLWPLWRLLCTSRGLGVSVCSLSHVPLWDPMDAAPVNGILQTRILEWVASFSSRWSSNPGDWTCICCINKQIFSFSFLNHWATWEAAWARRQHKMPSVLLPCGESTRPVLNPTEQGPQRRPAQHRIETEVTMGRALTQPWGVRKALRASDKWGEPWRTLGALKRVGEGRQTRKQEIVSLRLENERARPFRQQDEVLPAGRGGQSGRKAGETVSVSLRLLCLIWGTMEPWKYD